jgi:hypothetical protein
MTLTLWVSRKSAELTVTAMAGWDGDEGNLITAK